MRDWAESILMPLLCIGIPLGIVACIDFIECLGVNLGIEGYVSAGALGIAIYSMQRARLDSVVTEMSKTRERMSKERALFVYESLYVEEQRDKDTKERRDPKAVYSVAGNGWLADPVVSPGLPMKDLKPELGEKVNLNPFRPWKGMPLVRRTYSVNLQYATNIFLFCNDTYALSSYAPDFKNNKAEMKLAPGNYLDFVDTCDYLAYEIARETLAKDHPEGMKLKSLKGRRDRNPFDLNKRFTAIGVITLTILKNIPDHEDEIFFLVHKRGNNLAEGNGSYHAIPAGSYQPLNRYALRDLYEKKLSDSRKAEIKAGLKLSPAVTAVKEFVEEVPLCARSVVGDIYSMDYLRSVKDQLCADLFFLGITLEPLNLKAELLSYMVIDVEHSELFGDDKSLKSIEEKLAKIDDRNNEGSILILPFKDDYLDQFESNDTSIPAFREILRLVGRNEKPNLVTKQILEGNVENNLKDCF